MVSTMYANANHKLSGKKFDPKKYGMVLCPSCEGKGYIQNGKRRPCPNCGGFGYITKEQAQEDLKGVKRTKK